MAKLFIRKEGDPILRQTSRVVTEITPRIRTLVADMLETMREADGCGLAAVQIGVLRRIVVIETEENKPYVMINPRIVEQSGHQENVEGCLSLPSRWGVTARPATVTAEATDLDGNVYRVTGTDLLARAICHELDHLDGKLFTDVMIREITEEEMAGD